MITCRSSLAMLTLAAALFFTSCRKNSDDIAALISDTEAAEITETAVAERTAGATLPAVEAAKLLESNLFNCGVPDDTTFQRSQSTGPASYDHIITIGWLVNCNPLNVPQDATVDVTGAGAFNSTRWSGSRQSAGQLVLTGVAPSATAYVANGTYALAGQHTGDLRRTDPSIEVTTTLNLTNLTIRKSDYQITGGTGEVEVAATTFQGHSRTVNGTLVFHGNGTATVTVNGHAHTFLL